MGKKCDLTGQRFGRLVVLHEVPKKPGDRRIRWLCQCDCGNTCEAPSDSLRGGKGSCGCIRREISQKAREKALLNRQIYLAAKEQQKIKCPYPANACRKSMRGMCCFDCKEYEKCDDVCHNTPDKCGLRKGGQQHENSVP